MAKLLRRRSRMLSLRKMYTNIPAHLTQISAQGPEPNTKISETSDTAGALQSSVKRAHGGTLGITLRARSDGVQTPTCLKRCSHGRNIRQGKSSKGAGRIMRTRKKAAVFTIERILFPMWPEHLRKRLYKRRARRENQYKRLPSLHEVVLRLKGEISYAIYTLGS
jgi:hypothetical protein